MASASGSSGARSSAGPIRRAFVALGVGIVAAVAFPILMVRRRDPLVPPVLFRIRAFAVINTSTFLIYGALYIYSFLQSVFLQGVLGYTRARRRRDVACPWASC